MTPKCPPWIRDFLKSEGITYLYIQVLEEKGIEVSTSLVEGLKLSDICEITNYSNPSALSTLLKADPNFKTVGITNFAHWCLKSPSLLAGRFRERYKRWLIAIQEEKFDSIIQEESGYGSELNSETTC